MDEALVGGKAHPQSWSGGPRVRRKGASSPTRNNDEGALKASRQPSLRHCHVVTRWAAGLTTKSSAKRSHECACRQRPSAARATHAQLPLDDIPSEAQGCSVRTAERFAPHTLQAILESSPSVTNVASQRRCRTRPGSCSPSSRVRPLPMRELIDDTKPCSMVRRLTQPQQPPD